MKEICILSGLKERCGGVVCGGRWRLDELFVIIIADNGYVFFRHIARIDYNGATIDGSSGTLQGLITTGPLLTVSESGIVLRVVACWLLLLFFFLLEEGAGLLTSIRRGVASGG